MKQKIRIDKKNTAKETSCTAVVKTQEVMGSKRDQMVAKKTQTIENSSSETADMEAVNKHPLGGSSHYQELD